MLLNTVYFSFDTKIITLIYHTWSSNSRNVGRKTRRGARSEEGGGGEAWSSRARAIPLQHRRRGIHRTAHAVADRGDRGGAVGKVGRDLAPQARLLAARRHGSVGFTFVWIFVCNMYLTFQLTSGDNCPNF